MGGQEFTQESPVVIDVTQDVLQPFTAVSIGGSVGGNTRCCRPVGDDEGDVFHRCLVVIIRDDQLRAPETRNIPGFGRRRGSESVGCGGVIERRVGDVGVVIKRDGGVNFIREHHTTLLVNHFG